MCGLVGVVSGGNLSATEQKVFAELLQADIVRGDDSFGVFQVEAPSKLCSYHKIAGPTPKRYIESSEEFSKYLSTACVARIGHNRAATRGEVTSANAHPFREGHVTLVHNGTLRENIGKFEVDSHWLTSHIANSENVAETLGKVNGAYALIWYDQKEKRIFVARNGERPLHVAKAKHGTTWFFASEGKMLEWILERNKVNHDGVTEVPKDKLFGYPVEYGKTVTEEAIPQKKWQSSYGAGYGYGDWEDSYPSGRTSWRNNSVRSQQSSAASSAQTADRWAEQKLLLEVEDWWPISASTIRSSNGTLVQAYAALAKVTGIVPPIHSEMAGTIGSQVLILNLSQERLDYIVEENFGLAVGYSRMAGKPLEYYIIPHTNTVSGPVNHFHYSMPNIRYAKENTSWDVDNVSKISGFFVSGSSARPTNPNDWADALYEAKDVDENREKSKEVTPAKEVPQRRATISLLPAPSSAEKEKPAETAGGTDAGKSDNAEVKRTVSSVRLNVVCGECATPLPKNDSIHVSGVVCVCSKCAAKHMTKTEKVTA